jgi:hypothetical protein
MNNESSARRSLPIRHSFDIRHSCLVILFIRGLTLEKRRQPAFAQGYGVSRVAALQKRFAQNP